MLQSSLLFLIVSAIPVTSATVGTPQHSTVKNLYLSPSTSIELKVNNAGSDVVETEYLFGDTGKWAPAKGPIRLNSLGSGPFKLQYRSYGSAGNYETPHTLNFIIDSTPPVSRLDIASPIFKSTEGKIYISSNTKISISATDDLSGINRIDYRIDNSGWAEFREPFTLSDEGVHRIEYRSVDNVGNEEKIHSEKLVYDSTPPITTLNVKIDDNSDTLYINKPANITLTANDMSSGIKSTEYKIDNGKWLNYAPFTVDDRITHVFSYRSTDNVDNRERDKIVHVKQDKTPPVTTLSLGIPHHKSTNGEYIVTDGTFFYLSAKDTQSGVKRSEYRIDDGEWTPYSSFNIQFGGRHSIEFRSFDNAGNAETARRMSVTVDDTPPVTTASIGKKKLEQGETFYSADPVSITLNPKEGNSGVKSTEFRINNGDWSAYKPFTISAEGVHMVEFHSTDQLGNIEPTRFVQIVIDRTPPETKLLIGEPKRIDQGVVYISDKTVIALSAVDKLSGVKSSEYRIVGTGERYGTEPFNIMSDGEYKIYYSSVDKNDNREKEHFTIVKVQTPKSLPTPPALVNKPSNKPKVALDKAAAESDIPESIRLISAEKNPKKKLSLEEQQAADAAFGDASSAPPLDTTPSVHKGRIEEYKKVGWFNLFVILTIMIIL